MILSLETLQGMYDDHCDAVECLSVTGRLSFKDWLDEEIFDGFIFRHRDGSLNDIDEHQAFYESFESKLREEDNEQTDPNLSTKEGKISI